MARAVSAQGSHMWTPLKICVRAIRTLQLRAVQSEQFIWGVWRLTVARSVCEVHAGVREPRYLGAIRCSTFASIADSLLGCDTSEQDGELLGCGFGFAVGSSAGQGDSPLTCSSLLDRESQVTAPALLQYYSSSILDRGGSRSSRDGIVAPHAIALCWELFQAA